MPGLIKTGVTSWTEKTLVQSGWYPRGTSSAEARLRYYASRFSIVENDSTYYALPAPQHASLWVARTPSWFTMNVKAFASLTGHYTDPRRLPADLRDALAVEVREKRRVYPKDLGEDTLREIAVRFRHAIEPLRAAGRLGVVLFQFPVWFPCTRENERVLERSRELVPGCRVAVEFRNATWMSEKNASRTVDFLRAAGLVYTCVDEPQGFPSSIPPVAIATSEDLAVVRFHGRSAERWTHAEATASERFKYRYTDDELREWVPKIRELAAQARVVHVLMNNCHGDYAVVNAHHMASLLSAQAATRPAA
jgi:uncharacterized protein YecE (DUF72 family)